MWSQHFSPLILASIILFGYVTGNNIPPDPQSGPSGTISMYDSIDKLLETLKQTHSTISSTYTRLIQNETSPIGNWIAYSKMMKPINSAIMDSLFPTLSFNANLNLSTDCLLSLVDFAQAIDQQQTWAYRMLDASGNIFPSGLMSGSFSHLGEFDQCVETRMPGSGNIIPPIDGKYCLLKMNVDVPTNKTRLRSQDHIFNTTGTILQNTLFADLLKYGHILKVRSAKIGVCFPSTCSQSDIQLMVDQFLQLDKVSIHVDNCQTLDDGFKITKLQMVILAILVILVLLVIAATWVELAFYPKPKYLLQIESPLVAILLNFSASANTKSLLSTKLGTENLGSINGIRVLTMCWLVYAHAYFLSVKETFRSSTRFVESIYDLKMYFILNAWPAVEVFFIISALLHSYHLFQSILTTRKINIPKLIANRIARLWPNLWLTVGLVFLVPSMAQGPLWPDVMEQQVESCYNTWWKVPLFISNIRSGPETCQVHTWYLSVDMQLFIMSFFFIILIYKFQRKGVAMLIALAFLICSAISCYFFYYKYVPTILFNNVEERQIYEDMSKVYMPTYYHLTPYMVGIVTGYQLLRAKKQQSQVKRSVNVFLWIFCGLLTISVILSGYLFTAYTDTSLANQSIYAGFHRLIWSAAVSYLIFACENNQGGIFNTILSHKMFVPLGKLSYLVYLIHFIVTWARTGYTRAALVYSNYTLLNEFIINIVYSLILAFIFYLVIEAPFNKIYGQYIGKKKWSFGEYTFSSEESTSTTKTTDIESKCIKT
ncbi:hypothetical protein RDWZM_001975 [Blomia tropicalis]|uniref:Nose resistant-to-fluoxetine protein N-terminal domain-containing protein n=1 Tax=Blomia tropicalis TaxID=40697 RepID=A0A9Q0MH30_BLOTA|nr:hypothetical protein RDWZM_001975 [Blomia tropicalis]